MGGEAANLCRSRHSLSKTDAQLSAGDCGSGDTSSYDDGTIAPRTTWLSVTDAPRCTTSMYDRCQRGTTEKTPHVAGLFLTRLPLGNTSSAIKRPARRYVLGRFTQPPGPISSVAASIPSMDPTIPPSGRAGSPKNPVAASIKANPKSTRSCSVITRTKLQFDGEDLHSQEPAARLYLGAEPRDGRAHPTGTAHQHNYRVPVEPCINRCNRTQGPDTSSVGVATCGQATTETAEGPWACRSGGFKT